MKKLIYFTILVFLGLIGKSQTAGTIINVPYTTASTPTFQAYLYLPNDYGTTGSQRYPLFIFLHGSGESCPPVSNIYNSTTAGGPLYFIEHGLWPTGGFMNYRTGATEKYIVLGPQSACNSWSTSGDQLANIKTYMVQNYRVDSNRIIVSGLSSGGGGTVENTANLSGNETTQTFPSRYKNAAVIPMSPATNNPLQAWGAQFVTDSVPSWFFGDQNNDTYGEYAWNFARRLPTPNATTNGFINAIKFGYAYFTGNPGTNGVSTFNTGHGPWNTYYNPTFRVSFTDSTIKPAVTGTFSIYEWGLMHVRNSVAVTTPTANAGSNQSITQPTSTVTLTGSGTAGTGHNIPTSGGYAWTQVSGPTSTITTPTLSSTTVTGMTTAGAYVYQLKVTNEIGAFATSQVTITVISNAPHANAGPDQTITLPISSVTLDGTGSSGGITSYAWSQLTGPNTGNINSATAATTSVTALIAGVYTFQLSLNSGASKDTVQITVQPVQPCGPHNKIILHPFSDSTYFINNAVSHTFQAGDTIVFTHTDVWKSAVFQNMNGAPGCPIVLQNDSGPIPFTSPPNGHRSGNDYSGMKFASCSHIHLQGNADPTTKYGFFFQYDPVFVYQTTPALIIDDKSTNVEVNNVSFRNVDIAIVAEVTENCDTTFNWPNWFMDSIIIHDIKVRRTWNEGFYLGNTSPDNALYDHRPTVCGVDTFYYKPAKNGYTQVYNIDMDSTGRSGIQLANAIVNPAGARSEIFNCTVKHAGLNGDDAQGCGIDPGLYTVVRIHDNVITNTYTFGVGSLGANGTSTPLEIYNNRIDSAGFLRTFNNATTDSVRYNPETAPTFRDSLTYPYPIFVTTRPMSFTTDSLPGTAIHGLDSLNFIIKNNTLGLFKAATRPDSNVVGNSTAAIQIEQDSRNTTIQKNGNVICGNTFFNDQPATVFTDNRQGVINYSTNCGNAIKRLIASIGDAVDAPAIVADTLILPLDSTFIEGYALADSLNNITNLTITQIGGPSCTITQRLRIPTSGIGQSLIIDWDIKKMLTPGIYSFSIIGFSDAGTTASTSVSITILGALPNPKNYMPVHKYSKKRILGH